MRWPGQSLQTGRQPTAGTVAGGGVRRLRRRRRSGDGGGVRAGVPRADRAKEKVDVAERKVVWQALGILDRPALAVSPPNPDFDAGAGGTRRARRGRRPQRTCCRPRPRTRRMFKEAWWRRPARQASAAGGSSTACFAVVGAYSRGPADGARRGGGGGQCGRRQRRSRRHFYRRPCPCSAAVVARGRGPAARSRRGAGHNARLQHTTGFLKKYPRGAQAPGARGRESECVVCVCVCAAK